MKRIISMLTLAAAVVAVLVMSAIPAQADSPHFIKKATKATLNDDGTLTVKFKEAGLGANEQVDITLSADATATYVCVNRGGTNPSAANKETVSGPVSASGTFTSDQNGQVVSSLTVSPPSAGSFTCPNGQSLELASVSYTNVTLTDTTNNVSASLGTKTFRSGCLLPDVKNAC